MFNRQWFNWSGISIQPKQPETLDQSLYCKDGGNTRVGSSAVSMSSPLAMDTKKTDQLNEIHDLTVLNNSLERMVQRNLTDLCQLEVKLALKDADIEEFRRTVESLLIKKNQVEIELECERSKLDAEHEAYLNVSCLLHEVLSQNLPRTTQNF